MYHYKQENGPYFFGKTYQFHWNVCVYHWCLTLLIIIWDIVKSYFITVWYNQQVYLGYIATSLTLISHSAHLHLVHVQITHLFINARNNIVLWMWKWHTWVTLVTDMSREVTQEWVTFYVTYWHGLVLMLHVGVSLGLHNNWQVHNMIKLKE